MTIAGMVKNTLSAGAMFASVLEVVPNKPIELAGRLSAVDGMVTFAVVSLIAVHHLSVRYRQRR
jgi:hypothetical protein